MLDDDVLAVALVLAWQRGISLGSVISGLARDALRASALKHPQERSGFPLLPIQAPGAVLDLQLVYQLRDELL